MTEGLVLFPLTATILFDISTFCSVDRRAAAPCLSSVVALPRRVRTSRLPWGSPSAKNSPARRYLGHLPFHFWISKTLTV